MTTDEDSRATLRCRLFGHKWRDNEPPAVEIDPDEDTVVRYSATLARTKECVRCGSRAEIDHSKWISGRGGPFAE